MKVGDLLNVDIQGITVTQAIVADMDLETVTIQIPGTEVVIGIRQSLSDETPEYTPEVDRVLLDDHEGGTKANNDSRPASSDSRPEPQAAPVQRQEVYQEPARSLREMNLDSSGID